MRLPLSFCLLLLLLFLLAPGRAEAQSILDKPLAYGGAVIGHTTKQELASYLGESLRCLPTGASSEGRQVEICVSRDPASDRSPQAIFVNGRLRAYRFFLPRTLTANSAVLTLEENYGPLLHINTGDVHRAGLRLWRFAVRPNQMLLYESRNSQTGQVRLRLHLSDGTDFESAQR